MSQPNVMEVFEYFQGKKFSFAKIQELTAGVMMFSGMYSLTSQDVFHYVVYLIWISKREMCLQFKEIINTDQIPDKNVTKVKDCRREGDKEVNFNLNGTEFCFQLSDVSKD